MPTNYSIILFDDCCHQWASTDSGVSFVESGTPDGGTPSVTTLNDGWPDAQMAINDGDYNTIVGIDDDFKASGMFLGCGIIAISPNKGATGTWTLNDPEKSTTGILPSPAFMDSANPQFQTDWQRAYSLAITEKAKTILFCTNTSSASEIPFYPRMTTDGGVTWNDVTNGLPASQPWSHAAFSKGGNIMYLLPDNKTNGTNLFIFKSIDSGATWNQLASGPVFPTLTNHKQNAIRIRCSSNGQTVIVMANDGNFWISRDAGNTWSNTNFDPLSIGSTTGNYGDCGITTDGKHIVIGFEQFIGPSFGSWPSLWISHDAGLTFTDITTNIIFPASTPFPTDNAGTGFTQCNIAPDGKGVLVSFNYGFPNFQPGSTMYCDVSMDGGTSFLLRSFVIGALIGSVGFFSGIYITAPSTTPTSLYISPAIPLPKPKYAYSFLLARECNPKGL